MARSLGASRSVALRDADASVATVEAEAAAAKADARRVLSLAQTLQRAALAQVDALTSAAKETTAGYKGGANAESAAAVESAIGRLQAAIVEQERLAAAADA
eukprot:6194784-Pleurochrysis_carterae.AAC.1